MRTGSWNPDQTRAAVVATSGEGAGGREVEVLYSYNTEFPSLSLNKQCRRRESFAPVLVSASLDSVLPLSRCNSLFPLVSLSRRRRSPVSKSAPICHSLNSDSLSEMIIALKQFNSR